jgi:DNA polymerase-3 subunit epsilon
MSGLVPRLRAWLGEHASGHRAAHARWVLLDAESTGLDPKHDRLLSLAAVAVHFDAGRPRIVPRDSFEVILRDEQAPGAPALDRPNILLHGIGLGARSQGQPCAAALPGFAQWAGSAPRVGFHVGFDRQLLAAASRRAGVPVPRAPWLDLAALAVAAHPQVRARALDEWLAHFGLVCATRHDAAGDAWSAAELLLRMWPDLQRAGVRDFRSAQALSQAGRWTGA